MSNEKNIGKGFAILSLAGILVKLISLLYVPILSNILGEVAYGSYSIVYRIFSFIYIIANSGVPVAVSKHVSELSGKNYHVAALRSFKIARSLLILLGFVLSIVMVIVAYTTKPEDEWMGILVLAPCVFFTAILSAYRGYFQGRNYMTPTASTQIIEQIFNFGFSIGFAAVLMSQTQNTVLGVAGGSVGTSIGAFAALVIIIIMFKKYSDRGLSVPADNIKSPYSYKELMRTLLKYSIPITVCSAIQFGGDLIDALNVKDRLMASGLEEDMAKTLFGYLNKSQQLINVPISLVIALTVAMLPAISSSVAVNNMKKALQKIRYSFRLCYTVCVPLAFGLSVLHAGIYRVLRYDNGSEILLFAGLTILFLATVQIQTSILQSLGRLYYVMCSLSVGIIFKLAVNYYLVGLPSFRIYGAVIGTYVSMLVVVCINQYLIKRENIRMRMVPVIWRPVAASIYMAAVSAVIYYIPQSLSNVFSGYAANAVLLIVAAGAGAFTYFAIMAKLKGLTKDDIMSISGKIYSVLPGFMKRMLS